MSKKKIEECPCKDAYNSLERRIEYGMGRGGVGENLAMKFLALKPGPKKKLGYQDDSSQKKVVERS